MIGKRVYIKELGQLGTVRTVRNGAPEEVEIQTPEGPKIINVLDKGYKVLTLLLAILRLLLQAFKS